MNKGSVRVLVASVAEHAPQTGLQVQCALLFASIISALSYMRTLGFT